MPRTQASLVGNLRFSYRSPEVYRRSSSYSNREVRRIWARSPPIFSTIGPGGAHLKRLRSHPMFTGPGPAFLLGTVSDRRPFLGGPRSFPGQSALLTAKLAGFGSETICEHGIGWLQTSSPYYSKLPITHGKGAEQVVSGSGTHPGGTPTTVLQGATSCRTG